MADEMNLGTEGQDVSSAGEGNVESNEGTPEGPSIDSLLAELAQSRADGIKYKAALDKALKETGELKKSLRAKQTLEEQEAEAKKEADEAQRAEIADLKAFKAKAEAKDRYLMQGMDAETASKAAEAEVNGDMDELSAIQKQFREVSIKAAQAEWLKSRPQVNAGTGGEQAVTLEKFVNMDARERTALKRTNPEDYIRLRDAERGGN